MVLISKTASITRTYAIHFLETCVNLEKYSQSQHDFVVIPVDDNTTNQDVYNKIENLIKGNVDAEIAFDKFLEMETKCHINPKNEFLEDNQFQYEPGNLVFAVFQLSK